MNDIKKEEDILKGRFMDLSESSYRSGQYRFTDFLSLSEQELFWQIKSQISGVGFSLQGGNPYSERKILRFGSVDDFGYEEDFPIVCLKVEALIQKFSDVFSHRDFLGALLNLGIQRGMLGDIFIHENRGYVFCLEKIAEFIKENLTRVKHTSVKVSIVEELPECDYPIFQEEEHTVTSLRIDVIVGAAYKASRSQSQLFFQERLVYLNGRRMENISGLLKEGDIVSLRGKGKFLLFKVGGITKKGKQFVTLKKFA